MEGEQKKSLHNNAFRVIGMWFMAVALVWTILEFNTAIVPPPDYLPEAFLTQMEGGYLGFQLFIIGTIVAIMFASTFSDLPTARAAFGAGMVVLPVWYLQNFTLMYESLSKADNTWSTVMLGCQNGDMRGSQTTPRLCRVGKGVAVLTIMFGVGIAALVWKTYSRAIEIEETATKAVGAPSRQPLVARIMSFISLAGLLIMIAAHMRIIGKRIDGPPLPGPVFEGADEGALLLLILSTAMSWYFQEDTGNLQTNAGYLAFVSALCAFAFWSTWIFKARALDGKDVSALGQPCRKGAASNEECNAFRAFDAGFGIIALAQTALAFTGLVGSFIKPPPPLDF